VDHGGGGKAVHTRQVDVEHRYVRFVLLDRGDDFVTRCDRGDDLNIRFKIQQGDQSTADHLHVLG
jgi:hypothetical protein